VLSTAGIFIRQVTRMEFDYLHAAEPDPFTFYRIPKELFDNPEFADVSTLAKVLYGIFLDRTSLSRKKGWIDEKGHLYIVFTIRQIMDCLKIGNKYAEKLLSELEDKAHLIERVRQGFGRPNLIYVKDFSARIDAEGHFRKCLKDISRDVPQTHQEMSNEQTTNTDMSETDKSETELLHREDGGKGRNADQRIRKAYEDHFDETACFPWLAKEYPDEKEQLMELRNLLVDTCCSRKKEIMIGGELIPIKLVRSRFMKLDLYHIQYVIEALKENTEKIRNMKAYLLTLLYNAPLTIQNYYSSWYRHDHAEGKT
jgi:hypothetical protein